MVASILSLLNPQNSIRALLCCAAITISANADAQVTRGFDRTATAGATAIELSRQPDYWIMEVQYKPVRLVWVDEVDQITGATSPRQVWYLSWRAIARPLDAQEKADDRPINTLDALPGPLKFIPQMTLVTYDDPEKEIPRQIIQDELFPSAMPKVKAVERHETLDMVSVVQDLPAPVDASVEDQPWIYGTATFRSVNPDTRFFKIIMSGFTNAYEVRAVEGEDPHTWRKVLVQRFFRPGDRFDPNNSEFQYSGQPEWVYQPDQSNAAKPTAAE